MLTVCWTHFAIMLWFLILGMFPIFGLVQNAALPLATHGVVCPQKVTRRDDYTYVPGMSGYKLRTRAVIWNEARITCEEEGSHLAIINSNAEANAINEVFSNSEEITGSPHPDFASIGFHDLYSEGQYVTIHGQTLARAGFTQWASRQPDNAGGDEDCGSIYKSGGLNDIDCQVKLGFICELPITQGYILRAPAN